MVRLNQWVLLADLILPGIWQVDRTFDVQATYKGPPDSGTTVLQTAVKMQDLMFFSQEDQLTHLANGTWTDQTVFRNILHAMSQHLHSLPGYHETLCDKFSVPPIISFAARSCRRKHGVRTSAVVQEFPLTITPLEISAGVDLQNVR